MRAWMLLLVAGFLVTESHAQSSQIRVDFERFTLPNGLQVILHRDATAPFVSVNTWYHVGSGSERPGRTGFAHLFEHLMFEGSQHVPEGAIDEWIESAGGSTNGSTSTDRTNYYVDAASNALELALFVDADRMANLLPVMTQEKLDGQRDVVKNERRQGMENQPYGMAFPVLHQYLYPANHPYHWPIIGSMDDLDAATLQDVFDFHRTYYAPNNASLVVAGDIDLAETRRMVEHWYGSIPRGPEPEPVIAPSARIHQETRVVLEDRVPLSRLYIAWHGPGLFEAGDAESSVMAQILGGGRGSRLYRRLVFETQLAQDVSASYWSRVQSGMTVLVITARPGVSGDALLAIVQEEIDRLKNEAPTDREVQQVVNRIESGFLFGLENVGGFGGKADRLNSYLVNTGNPDYFNEDLARYRALDARSIQAMAQTYLRDSGRVIVTVVPNGQTALAPSGSEPAVNHF